MAPDDEYIDIINDEPDEFIDIINEEPDEFIEIVDENIIERTIGYDSYSGIAGENLGGGKLVYMQDGKCYLYDADDITLADACFGMTKAAAVQDAPVEIQIGGVFTEVGLGLTANTIYYAGLNGLLTSNPTYATCTLIGYAINANNLKLDIQQSIITA